MEIADMIKETRKILHLTQYEYAEDIGTNQTTVSFMERGFMPSDEMISRIISYYMDARG